MAKKTIAAYKVVFDKGNARLIPCNLRNFELIPQSVIKGTKQILKDEDRKKGVARVSNLL